MKSLSAVGLFACIHFLSTWAFAGISVEGDLSRRADLGFSVSASDNRLAIKELEGGSPAARAGLIAGDIIVSVNGKMTPRSGTIPRPYWILSESE